MNPSPYQLDLFYKVALNPTYEIKRMMRLIVAKNHLSREEIVDRMNKIAINEGMRTTISKATLDNWLKDSDIGRMPSPAWLTIFCYIMNDVRPINAMLNPLGCIALDKDKQKLLGWAEAEIEKRKIIKKARLALESLEIQ